MHLVKAHIEAIKERSKNTPEITPREYILQQPGISGIVERGIASTLLKIGDAYRWWTSDSVRQEDEEQKEQKNRPKEGHQTDKPQQIEYLQTEREKKINRSDQSRQPSKLQKIGRFISNNATKCASITLGACFVASGIYTGGLTILPMIGFIYEATYAMILIEGGLGAAIGAVFGKTVSYMIGPDDHKSNTKPKTKETDNIKSDHVKRLDEKRTVNKVKQSEII